MKIVKLTFVISDEMMLKQVGIDWNDTDLKDNSELIKSLCSATLRAFEQEKENIDLQDLLHEQGIITE